MWRCLYAQVFVSCADTWSVCARDGHLRVAPGGVSTHKRWAPNIFRIRKQSDTFRSCRHSHPSLGTIHTDNRHRRTIYICIYIYMYVCVRAIYSNTYRASTSIVCMYSAERRVCECLHERTVCDCFRMRKMFGAHLL